jgi:hypothetical protein
MGVGQGRCALIAAGDDETLDRLMVEIGHSPAKSRPAQ